MTQLNKYGYRTNILGDVVPTPVGLVHMDYFKKVMDACNVNAPDGFETYAFDFTIIPDTQKQREKYTEMTGTQAKNGRQHTTVLKFMIEGEIYKRYTYRYKDKKQAAYNYFANSLPEIRAGIAKKYQAESAEARSNKDMTQAEIRKDMRKRF